MRQLKPFLKQAGYRDSDVTFVPVSGLHGDNLVKKSPSVDLKAWYKGPTLIEVKRFIKFFAVNQSTLFTNFYGF